MLFFKCAGVCVLCQAYESEEFEFSVALRPQRPRGLLVLGTGTPVRPPRLSHSS